MSQSNLSVEARPVRLGILALSALVILSVALVMSFAPQRSEAELAPGLLARINVSLNAASAIALIFGRSFVRAGNVTMHKRCMLAAFGFSATFLVTYLLHHASVGSVPFRGTGLWRPLYYGILIPHILLAAGIVPLALLSLYRGWTGKLAAHRRIVRYTLPAWLFVCVSGVAVYWLLYHVT